MPTDAFCQPFKGNGKPEPLKENLSGFWSRRIVAACMGALGGEGLVAQSVVIDPVLDE